MAAVVRKMAMERVQELPAETDRELPAERVQELPAEMDLVRVAARHMPTARSTTLVRQSLCTRNGRLLQVCLRRSQ